MPSIFDDPENIEEIGKYFSRAKRGTSPLGSSLMSGSWFNQPPPLTMGKGGLMSAQERQYAEKADIEMQKREKELKKVEALKKKHAEIKDIPFETYEEAMSYLRYLKSGQGWGMGVDEFPEIPAAEKEDLRFKGYKPETPGMLGRFLGGSKMTPFKINPPQINQRIVAPQAPKITPPAAPPPAPITRAVPTPEDTAAAQWAAANPNDPRAAGILLKLRKKGL